MTDLFSEIEVKKDDFSDILKADRQFQDFLNKSQNCKHTFEKNGKCLKCEMINFKIETKYKKSLKND